VNIIIDKRGVSMVELMVVMVIALIAMGLFAMNRDSQLEMAYKEEARVLINHIAEKEKIFYASNFFYYRVPEPSESIEDMGVHLGRNDYFGKVSVDVSTSTPYTEFNPLVTITLYGKNKMNGKTVVGKYDFQNDVLDIK